MIKFNFKNGLIKKEIFLLFCFLSFGLSAKQIPTVTGLLKTVPGVNTVFTPDTVSTSVSAVAGTQDYSIWNTVALKYDLFTDTFFVNPATVTAKISAYQYDALGNPIGTTFQKLNIYIDGKYNSPMIEQNILKLANGYSLTVTLDSVWVNGVQVSFLPRYVSIETEINMDRYYDFSNPLNTNVSALSIAAVTLDCDTLKDELIFTWTSNVRAEEYQVEWAYVNNYSASGTGTYSASQLKVDFKNNSTRITTTGTSCRVSLLYNKGFVAFRVRAVGRDYTNPTLYMYGPWSIANDNPLLSSLITTTEYYNIKLEHEKVKNWQYSATYAEEGKKKEVISYFDGSLRNRQTVTKNNSDKNVIVGETMYDYQGRPAVNVLPVPVPADTCTEPAIHYYKKFNVDDTNYVYSKNDFDLDQGGCNSSAAPMDTINGASLYYSNNNPDKSFQQGYLPHAKQYPFTQTEYTPDNTGRIRSQSGVGKDFKLGTGKETKYVYGQPNQIQLDRLFGSEAGDASHYKKNTVIDPNGQANVSYFNSQGKVIATALAGDLPTNPLTGGTNLFYINSWYSASKDFTVDAFNKDINGVSQVNTVPPSNDEIVFNTQLSVSFAGTYTFDYNMTIDTLGDPCLKSGFCLGCTYDFKINVTDECGNDLIAGGGGAPIDWVIGNVDTTGNKLTFTMTCNGMGPVFQDSAKFSLYLQPGVYTVAKVLKVNQQAKDFYVQNYLDTAYNSCVKTLDYFVAQEMAKIDTMDCYNSCANCIADLGTKDDFVSSGKGTAAQWDFLYEECQEPCKNKTLCDNTFDMMLSDVSPGGQYAKYNVNTNDASGEMLSVLNTGNGLNSNVLSANQANWKYPRLVVNGNIYPVYFDENGDRTKVILSGTAPNYSPAIDNNALVYTDTITNQKFTYPENLTNLADFIPLWNNYFARSLVMYHPEYAYYRSCFDHRLVMQNQTTSSDQFDSLMYASESFNQAYLNGFIAASYMGPGTALSKVIPFYWNGNAFHDPFVGTAYEYSTTVNPVAGTKTTYDMLNPAFHDHLDINAWLTDRVSNYIVVNGIGYSMPAVAAMLTRCGNNFNAMPTNSCLAFGTDYYPLPNALNDTIRNQEWRLFRSLYLAEKAKAQFKRMEFYARHNDDGNSNFFGGSNCCIGNPSFDPFQSGMISIAFPPAIPGIQAYPASAFFDASQPCGGNSWPQFAGVQRRFENPENISFDPNAAALQIYELTGQCPIVFELQNFLNRMAQDTLLDKTPVYMNTINEFTQDMYTAINGGVNPGNFINYKWMVSSNVGGTLQVNFYDTIAAVTKCTLTLDISGTGIPAFDSIIGINQLVYDQSGTGANPFKAVASYKNGGVVNSANIKGNSCLKLKSCAFPPECKPNQFAVDLQNLMNLLKAKSKLTGGVYYPIWGASPDNNLLTTVFKNTLGAPNSKIKYQFVAPNQMTFYDSLNASTKLVFTVLNSAPPGKTLDSCFKFANIKSDYNDLFTVDGQDSNSVTKVVFTVKASKITATDTIGLSMGECALPDPPECDQKEHKVRKDLVKLFNEIFTLNPGVSINLFNLANFTPLLKSYLPFGVGSTSSTYTFSNLSNPNFDTLTFSISGCNLTLFHYRNNGTIRNFTDSVVISDIEGVGSPDIAGNYNNFRAFATYSINGATVTDTIYGTSCWPIKNCIHCNGNDTLDLDNMTPNNEIVLGGQEVAFNAAYFTNCAAYYDTLVHTIHKYDITPYALANTFYLDSLIYTNATHFIQAGYCGCVQNYIMYLDSFVNNPLGPWTGPAVDIDHWNGCPHVTDSLTTCDSLYIQYVGIVTQYNDSVMANVINYPLIDTIYPASYFKKICICGKKFIANITAIINGTPIPPGLQSSYLTLKKACDFPPCNGGPPDSTFSFPPVTYQNPCVAQAINLANQNAQNDYQNYLDSMTTDIAAKYTQHCLEALENFHYNYTDKEHHFTLYYYDQAGNLVRTIPPEGVELLGITSDSDPLEQQVIAGRTNNVQNVFTSHRMATTYLYNSLNQLVSQSMPDHDNMNLCEGQYAKGIDTSLAINSLQFVTSNKGYLCGTKVLGASQTRGLMYTTNDGGSTWSRTNGIVAGDIQKSQFVSSTDGYAVSTYGMVLKTADGGVSWDLLTSIYSAGSPYFDKLNDLFVLNASTLLVGGIQQGSGVIYWSNNSGASFNAATVSGISAGDTLTGFSTDNTSLFASFRNGLSGRLFKTSAYNGTWTEVTSFVANNLKQVQYIYDTLAFAVGEDGTLLRSTTPNSSWQLLPTGVYNKFMDIHFKNRAEGVAIIDSAGGKGKIWKTFNGGLTWSLLSANGDHYKAFRGYDNDTTQKKLIAAGDNGLIAKILLENQPFGITKISAPSSQNLAFGDATLQNNKLITLAACGSTGRIHFSSDAQAGNPNWQSWYATQMGSATDTTYKKVLISYGVSGMGPEVKAILLGNNGHVLSFYYPLSGTPVLTQIGFSGTRYFADIAANTKADPTNFYAFDTVNKQVVNLVFSGSSVSSPVIYSGTTAGNVMAMDVSNVSVKFLIVGNTGNRRYGKLSGSTVNWTDVTAATKPTALNRVKKIIAGKIALAGIDGQYWTTSGSNLYLRNTGMCSNFRGLSADTLGIGLICGDAGRLCRLSNATGIPILVTVATTLNNVNFTDAAVDRSSFAGYVTAENGKVIYFPSYLGSTNSVAAIGTTKPLNGVTFKTGSAAAYAVGNDATILNYLGTASATNKNIFPASLNSVHFYDANNGYAIDNGSVIRRTSDGGQTWSVVLPNTSLPVISKVFSTKVNQAVIIGNALYAAVANGTALSNISVSGSPGSLDFNGIDFNPAYPSSGRIVGGQTGTFKIDATSPTAYNITFLQQAVGGAGSFDFEDVHVFDDTAYIAVGQQGNIYYHKLGNFYQQNGYTLAWGASPSSVTFKDVLFQDNYRGYVVGDNGAAIKCNLSTPIAQSGTVASNIAWDQFCNQGIYPYGTAVPNLALDFRAVGFSLPTKGMIVGEDNNFSLPMYSQKYAMLVNDQGGYFSTRFWYDKLGRLILSQNTKQFNKSNPDSANVKQAFSYTLYDALGRITEVGEKYENHDTSAVPSPKMKSIFGSDVNGYFNPDVIDDFKFNTWVTGVGRRADVTKTYYDEQTVLPPGIATQNNLRKRVATVSFENVFDGYDSTYQHATHYNYDIHGNVNTLWQENPNLISINQNFKRIDYEYDLISGKVNKVIYQPDSVDQFIHQYTYDADNRITKVETSKDNLIYETDAKYFYYAHGPLARIEYGKNQVQGMDFAYTLQGWIKGVNSNILDYHTDMGRDGDTTGANPNGNFGRDAMGYGLGYYMGDYEAIDFNKWNTASTRFESYVAGTSDFGQSQMNLFNGNVQRMVTSLSRPDTVTGNIPTAQSHQPFGASYWYDQLNRINYQLGFVNLDTTAAINTWQNGAPTWFLNASVYGYDENGNMQYQYKTDSAASFFDGLSYNYQRDGSFKLMRNRLYHVNDYSAYYPMSSPQDGDIEDQGPFNGALGTINQVNNYRYDEIGNLVHDSIEEVDTIAWNVYGKIKYIKRISGSGKFNLFFDYDAQGNRVAKRVYNTFGGWKYSDYYIRDAQGNVMTVYHEKPIGGMSLSYKQSEVNIYGNSKLGTAYPDLEMIGAINNLDTVRIYLGNKQYEMSNHLGNVLTTVSDKKIPVNDNTDSIIDYYVGDIITATDYYPFGQEMYGRRYHSDKFRLGFNGKEKDPETKGEGNSYDLGERMLDPRLGRTTSIDKYSYKFPGESPYSFAMNTPISAIDPDGKLIIFIGGLRLWEKDKDQAGSGKSGGLTGIYSSDVFGHEEGEGYWHTKRNSFGEAEDIAAKFMDRIGDDNAWYASGSSRWKSQAEDRKKEGMAKAEQFHAMVQSGEIKLEKDETIKIVSHSQGGAHAEGFAEQLLSYKDAEGKPLYKIEVIYNVTPHQPTDINAIPGVRNVQYSHPNDAVSSDAPKLMPNGKSKFGQINGVNEFDGRQILGGEGQPKATGASGNRSGHNVTDNGYIFNIPKGDPGYVAPRQDNPGK